MLPYRLSLCFKSCIQFVRESDEDDPGPGSDCEVELTGVPKHYS